MSRCAVVVPEVSEFRDRLYTGIEWLLNHGRVSARGDPCYGAFRRGVVGQHSTPLGAYTEITGYGLSLLSFLVEQLAGALPLDRTKLTSGVVRPSADFLFRVQRGDGAYGEWTPSAKCSDEMWAYSFDTAVCARGLIAAYRLTEDERYLRSAIAAGQWLLSMQKPDGTFYSLSLGARERPVDAGGFFGDGSVIQAKIGMVLTELWVLTGEEGFRLAAARTCESAGRLQRADGAFWATRERSYVFSHAHCYACEGLLYVGSLLQRGDLEEAASRGVRWLASRFVEEGRLMSRYHISAKPDFWRVRISQAIKRHEPFDALAQSARLFLVLNSDGEFRSACTVAFKRLLCFQQPDGGFAYMRTRFGRSHERYTWPAQFAVQALAWMLVPPRIHDLF